MRSIKWCHFQWPWTNPRYGYSYYRRRIRNNTQAFEWYQFGWPSMIYSPDFKVTIIQPQITRKWYNIELCLQWPTNRKSYVIYRITPFSMTLNDPYPRYQGHAIFDAEYLGNGMIYRHSFNGILINTHTPYSTVSFRMTLSELEWLDIIFNDKKRRAVSLRQLSFLSEYLFTREAKVAIK